MTERPVLAVSAVVVHDGKLLMVRRGERSLWALPGGRVEPRETLSAAVRREVREETGLRVRVGEVCAIAQRVPRGDGPHYVIIAHRAQLLGGRLQAGDDAPEVEWVPVEAIFDRPTVPGLRGRLVEAGVLGPATRSGGEDGPQRRARRS